MLNIFELISSGSKLTKAEKKFLEELFKEQSKRMWIMAIDILKDRQMAEDAVQSSFVKLIEKVKLLMNFTDKDKLNGYVYVVTKNMALYQIRKQKGHFNIDIDAVSYQLMDRKVDVETALVMQEEINGIQENMKYLSQMCRETVYLRHFLGLEYQEIAEIMHTTVPNVREKVYEGLKKIRKAMAAQGEKDE